MHRFMVMGEVGSAPRKEVGILEILRRKASKMRQVPGGTPISYKEALELRRLVQGTAMHSLSEDYKSMGFNFNDEDGCFPFGLQVERNGCRGVIIGVQAHLIRHLVFKGNKKEDILKKDVLRPGSQFRREALVGAICEMLWRAGEETKCCVTFPQEGESLFTQGTDYRNDGLTEKLQLYYFTDHDELYSFMRKYMDFFESESTSGVLLFVYSMVMSRGLENALAEIGGPLGRLLTVNEDATQALINLLIIGRNVQGLTNTDEVYDDEGKQLPIAKIGIHNRGTCGFMFWHKDEEPHLRTEVGSMLKTPKHPIWVTQVNGNYGVMFSLNPDLTRDWREEHKFDLHYYTGLNTQTGDARLTVETRYGRKMQLITNQEAKAVRIPALEYCIMTKWSGAEIDWNGTMPFV